MIQLFSNKSLAKSKSLSEDVKILPETFSTISEATKLVSEGTSDESDEESIDEDLDVLFNPVKAFGKIGLSNFLCENCQGLGYQRPTPIQTVSIPSILSGRNFIGVSMTGSGKTAAFALPILQKLSQDPFGIFALILTPTRELAVQIADQFKVFCGGMLVKVCLVIGGLSMLAQSLELSKSPHIVIATPGRLKHHLFGPSPPNLSRCRFLVLDEADRLLGTGFQQFLCSIYCHLSLLFGRDLPLISSHCSYPSRQTLLFSATLTSSDYFSLKPFLIPPSSSSLENNSSTLVHKIDSEGNISEICHEENKANKKQEEEEEEEKISLPSNLDHQYLFMPANVKPCYLVGLLREFMVEEEEDDKNDEGIDVNQQVLETTTTKKCKSCILFVSSCQK